ncbi:type II toxin-antitoxin system VapB family antitoxin [Roseococcus sp. SDR]|uniref:type II toxin-antitoxin system VapB family antitoxin n=1 Tax=Roseococcus sp. SDR TaxID=2835532 RepID=UPI001BCFAEF0|nr:type II toxin-antitoxin system VapB family antitoxin [Roseococcus sp. SDR]MBS7791528.1 type II toxin-antitoxin system VapB family antitoxin [Roseococcus sp. SDR]MBV1846842.1 type II toxin-antitoxin system VapB family antitoxin [Roseococcus sp. SDR]
MGQLNIKDEALIEKVRRLAEKRQTTQTDVLRQLVDEALARDDAEREARRLEKLAAIREITARTAKLFPPGTTSDHSDLYDENGLPK